MQPDPYGPDVLTWFESYDRLIRRAGVPLYDLVQRGKAKNDAPFYFSWYVGDFTTDPEFAATSTDTERANPSLIFVDGVNA